MSATTPQGWQLIKLRDIATLKTGPFGSALHKSDYTIGGMPLINPTHIKNGKLAPSTEVSVSPEIAERLSDYRLKKGDIVMGRRGEMGRCAVVLEHAQDWLCGTGSVVVKSTFAAHPNYLQRFLTAPATVAALIGDSVGSTMINLNQGVLLGLDIPLAPLPEQKRIAEKLDSVLARVDACRDRLDRLPALLKRFRQSILAAATSGRLTEDWRYPENADEWRNTDIQSVAKVGTGSTPLRSTANFYAESGTPWVTSAATSKEVVRDAEQFVTNDAIVAHRLKTYPVGTLLVAMYGEGKTRGQVTELGIPATINQACAAVVVDETLALKAFVKFALQANYLAMRELAEGGNQPNLNLSKIKEFPLALPPLPEQTEIVRRVEILFAFADRLEARLAAARKQVGQLTPAVLAKAFRGELVAQDPADEPAAELLKRLAAQRAAAPKAKRGRSPA